ncbi:hypothetical protein R1A27_20270 [Methylobacterium sp. NMS12]|uniref:hypothetical protein n=1 Tax=Methylobacterium sp. NMS12 TaxID=3079766 RepID=UPI003F8856BA
MSGKSPARAGKSPEAVMNTAPTEARCLIELIAGPLRLGENVKAALSRVARTTGLPDRRVRGIWHHEARSIRAEEMDRLRQAARDARAKEQARAEYRSALTLIAACDATLRVPGEDLARSSAREVGEGHDGAGRDDRSVDRGAGR